MVIVLEHREQHVLQIIVSLQHAHLQGNVFMDKSVLRTPTVECVFVSKYSANMQMFLILI